jgi:hypothetical protein
LIDEEVKARMELSVSTNSEGNLPNRLEGNEDQLIREPDSRSVTPPSCPDSWDVPNYDGDLVLKKATKILGHYARVGQATKATAHFPGLLGSSLNLINMPAESVPWEARLSCIWTIANVS